MIPPKEIQGHASQHVNRSDDQQWAGFLAPGCCVSRVISFGCCANVTFKGVKQKMWCTHVQYIMKEGISQPRAWPPCKITTAFTRQVQMILNSPAHLATSNPLKESSKPQWTLHHIDVDSQVSVSLLRWAWMSDLSWPLSNSSKIMSQPPRNSPPAYSWGYVGHWLYFFNASRTSWSCTQQRTFSAYPSYRQQVCGI